MPKPRRALIKRKTVETDVSLEINLDGKGSSYIKTPLDFLNHMLTLFAKHGTFSLRLKARGDTRVDIHHTNEDIGICLGLALKKALGKKIGIRRFGFASLPMDEALVEVSLDMSGRPYLKVASRQSPVASRQSQIANQEYDFNYLKQFLQALVNNAGITLYVEVIYGEDLHHIIEAVFKALARALQEAVSLDPRIEGILSTKGML